MRRLIVLIILLLLVLGALSFVKQRSPSINEFLNEQRAALPKDNEKIKIVTEESVVIDVVKKSGPSVVTIAAQVGQQPLFDGDDPFSFFELPRRRQSTEPQNIGSGFLVSDDGFIVTNKHVVSDSGVSYIVITQAEKKYTVEKIYRDPLNDIAIIKINPNQNREQLKPLRMGDSSKLQVGQLVIAIGTPLGEFNNSVTTGVVSGLGGGIIAGSAFEGFAEQLDNVIQTDAAINPGNSGEPLLNSSGQVIGVNSAVAQSGQNIGFALPINVIKDSLQNFNQTGQFNRPFLGVSYQMISRDVALRNDLPEGAYIRTVTKGSAADKSGVQAGDVITKIDGQKMQADKLELAQVISKKKVGDSLILTVWRDNSADGGEARIFEVKAVLESAPEQ